MSNIYQLKIDVVVSSKYQKTCDDFLDGFLKTTKKFKDIRLFIINKSHLIPNSSNVVDYKHDNYGGIVINEILKKYTLVEKRDIFADLNDDLWFSEGWLEDTLSLLEQHDVVSPGTADTNDQELFKKAIEETKNEEGVIEMPNAACWFMKTRIFRRIGLYPEYYGSGPLDLDLAWRMHLNKIKMASSKKIKIAHLIMINKKADYKQQRTDKKYLFYDRYGYQSCRDLINLYRPYRSYFWKYKKFI